MIKQIRESFGTHLKSARKSIGMTQEKLAEILDVQPASVSRWESGKFMPSEKQIPLICKALKKEASFFFDRQETNKKEIESVLLKGNGFEITIRYLK